MTTRIAFAAVIALVGLQRLAEMRLSRRNARRSFEMGGFERGRGHVPAMVALHAALLAGAVLEVFLLERPFRPALAAPMLALALAAQGVRLWTMAALGPRWTTRVIAVPGLPPVRTGPYRWLDHPNYLAVAAEGAALPLLHSAWVTAAVFTVLDSILLAVRVRCEEAALREAST